jgi:hypothetical protein
MSPLARAVLALAVLAPLAVRAGEACVPQARKRLPSRQELARLCPKEPLFGKEPLEVGDERGGCSLMFMDGGRMLQVAAEKQLVQVPGGPKANAEKASEAFGQMGGGRGPAVKRMAWKKVEAYALENTPGYFVDSGGEVVVVHVTPVMAKPVSDDCVEAVVADVAKRYSAR